MANSLPASSGTSVGCAAGRISPAGPTTVTGMEKNDEIRGETVCFILSRKIDPVGEGSTLSHSALIQRKQESLSADFNDAETLNVQPQLTRYQPSLPDFSIHPP